MTTVGGCAHSCHELDPGLVSRVASRLKCTAPAAAAAAAAAAPSQVELLAGLTAAELWPATNLAMPAWLLLALLPKWRLTPLLVLVPPLVHAAIYCCCVVTVLADAGGSGTMPDFATLDGVVALFSDPATARVAPSAVFVGWLHYLAFDLLVGR